MTMTFTEPSFAEPNPVSQPVAQRMRSMEKRALIQEALVYHVANPRLTQEPVVEAKTSRVSLFNMWMQPRCV